MGNQRFEPVSATAMAGRGVYNANSQIQADAAARGIEELRGLDRVSLDKESAAEKIGRIRRAKQRDKEKADRAKERARVIDGYVGYWKGAVAIPQTGTPKISYDWYRTFLQTLIDNNAHTWFAPLIAWGEVLVGIGLIVGGLVGIAAFFGALMNMSFMLAGSASTNPVLFFLAVTLMLGWHIAGYYGADRFILPIIGAPWQPGKLFKQRGSPVPVPAS